MTCAAGEYINLDKTKCVAAATCTKKSTNGLNCVSACTASNNN